jgi:glycosyltransferase involved in cell wall biosynthesis
MIVRAGIQSVPETGPQLPAEAATAAGENKGRIVLAISSLSPGGAERIISGLANHWAAMGWGVTLVSFGPSEEPYYPLDPKVQLVQLGFASKPNALGQTLRRVRAFRRIVRTTRPVAVVSFLTRINVVSIMAATGLKTRLVVSERNNADLQYVHPAWRILRYLTYPMAFRLVSPTRGLLESFSWPIRLRGCVIPNSVDPSFSALPWRARSDRTILAVGRLVRQKGFDLLLRAFAQIAPFRPEWSLVIWGEGEERASLLELRDALGLTRSVRMPGVTASPGEWAHSGEIFVLSSRFEGFANVVAEAMAAGLPVLAFDCDWGPGELIRHETDGLLVKSGDVGALANGLLRLTGDPALRRVLGHAARRSIERIQPELIMARWDDLLVEATMRQGAPNDRVAG